MLTNALTHRTPLLGLRLWVVVGLAVGAAFLLLADEDTLSTEVQPSASLLGRYAGSELGQVPERPPSAALVVLGAADAATRLWLERSTWRDAPRRDLVTEHAHHEALGAVALAVAVEAIARHEVERALVLSGGGGRASAVLLGAAAPRCQ
jgi:hypothetical protein